MKRPCEIDVPPPSRTSIVSGPGKVAETAAAAAIPPNICAKKTQMPRVAGTAPTSHNVSVTYVEACYQMLCGQYQNVESCRTAGLNIPPLTR
jgi:hypothetical protein